MPKGARQRSATVRTLQFSEFRQLYSHDFLRIAEGYPDVRAQMNYLAKTREVLFAKDSSEENYPRRKSHQDNMAEPDVDRQRCEGVEQPLETPVIINDIGGNPTKRDVALGVEDKVEELAKSLHAMQSCLAGVNTALQELLHKHGQAGQKHR